MKFAVVAGGRGACCVCNAEFASVGEGFHDYGINFDKFIADLALDPDQHVLTPDPGITLGKGAYGVVTRGVLALRGNAPVEYKVAIKTVTPAQRDVAAVLDEIYALWLAGEPGPVAQITILGGNKEPNPASLELDPEHIIVRRMNPQLTHPNIVHMFGVEVHTHSGLEARADMEEALSDVKKINIVMEMGSLTLHDLVDERSGYAHVLTDANARRIIMQLADGLAHIHRRNLLHNDIKPANVILFPRGGTTNPFEENGTVKLADFGLSVMVGDTRPPSTFLYQKLGLTKQDSKTTNDMYSLGLVLWQMIALQMPYVLTDEEYAHMAGAFEQHASGTYSWSEVFFKYRPSFRTKASFLLFLEEIVTDPITSTDTFNWNMSPKFVNAILGVINRCCASVSTIEAQDIYTIMRDFVPPVRTRGPLKSND